MPINNIKNNLGEVSYMKIANLQGQKVGTKDNLGKSRVQERANVKVQNEPSRVQRRAQVQTTSQVKVQLNSRNMVEGAAKQISNMPEVREEKVAQIRQQIQAGNYNVSNEQIARAMIGNLLKEIA